MQDHQRRRLTRFPVLVYLVLLAVGSATVGIAQATPCIVCPTPTPPTPEPTLTPEPATPTPQPTDQPEPVPSGVPQIPTPTPEPKATPKGEATASPVVDANAKADQLPPELQSQQNFDFPVIARTRPRNTFHLVDMLEPLVKAGLPRAEVLVEGFGRFPVAGLVSYSDDWLAPRFHPYPHLHHGLDLFADFGTPIRTPDKGVITALTENPLGGIGTWMRGSDGTHYYFAHQMERVEGIYVGQHVDIGTVIGFVGDTGNAQGGAPHLHFEIHRGEAIPPKPTVDRWLDEAEQLAPRFVEARLSEIQGKKNIVGGTYALGSSNKPKSDLEASMLLTLLDPVGGSVGLLPQLQLSPANHSPVPDRILAELIHQRLDGYLLVPSSQGLHQAD
jgi:peptidoglycan LD-endopeptidase LytH